MAKEVSQPRIDLTGAVTGTAYRILNWHSEGLVLCYRSKDGDWVSVHKMNLDGIRRVLVAVAAGAYLVADDACRGKESS